MTYLRKRASLSSQNFNPLATSSGKRTRAISELCFPAMLAIKNFSSIGTPLLKPICEWFKKATFWDKNLSVSKYYIIKVPKLKILFKKELITCWSSSWKAIRWMGSESQSVPSTSNRMASKGARCASDGLLLHNKVEQNNNI